jgi:hypothetical protein
MKSLPVTSAVISSSGIPTCIVTYVSTLASSRTSAQYAPDALLTPQISLVTWPLYTRMSSTRTIPLSIWCAISLPIMNNPRWRIKVCHLDKRVLANPRMHHAKLRKRHSLHYNGNFEMTMHEYPSMAHIYNTT